MVATCPMWLLSTWTMIIRVTETLDFLFYLIFNLNVYSQMWLVATVLSSVEPVEK